MFGKESYAARTRRLSAGGRQSYRRTSTGKAVSAALLIIAACAAWLWFFGWLLTVVIGWFGPHLAVWQGVVISLIISGFANQARGSK